MIHTTAILAVKKISVLYVEHSLEDPVTLIVAFRMVNENYNGICTSEKSLQMMCSQCKIVGFLFVFSSIDRERSLLMVQMGKSEMGIFTQ